MKLMKQKYGLLKIEIEALARGTVAILSDPESTEGQRKNARMLDDALRHGWFVSQHVLRNFLDNYRLRQRNPLRVPKRGRSGPTEMAELVPGDENGHYWAADKLQRSNYAVDRIEAALSDLSEAQREFYSNTRTDRRVQFVQTAPPVSSVTIAELSRKVEMLQQQVAEMAEALNVTFVRQMAA